MDVLKKIEGFLDEVKNGAREPRPYQPEKGAKERRKKRKAQKIARRNNRS